jgi:hypothetical protein
VARVWRPLAVPQRPARERERVGERESVCVCVSERERATVCVYGGGGRGCLREREIPIVYNMSKMYVKSRKERSGLVRMYV